MDSDGTRANPWGHGGGSLASKIPGTFSTCGLIARHQRLAVLGVEVALMNLTLRSGPINGRTRTTGETEPIKR
ncbi:N-6 DNA methylase [Anopheles sinensis]|uniref:N-6 DNA methylase n=1 Tax=Anopheles sinensis TaxID=74873 RepID=A0A084VWF8_ANOSI|nr:N-6 DNA methylase [Anopheles sinensis]